MARSNKEWKAGDLVFAKVKGYPPWPARVNAGSDVHIWKSKLPIFFYGTREFANVSIKNLYPYEEFRHMYGRPKKFKGFNEGLAEIKHNKWVEWPGNTQVIAGVKRTLNDAAEKQRRRRGSKDRACSQVMPSDHASGLRSATTVTVGVNESHDNKYRDDKDLARRAQTGSKNNLKRCSLPDQTQDKRPRKRRKKDDGKTSGVKTSNAEQVQKLRRHDKAKRHSRWNCGENDFRKVGTRSDSVKNVTTEVNAWKESKRPDNTESEAPNESSKKDASEVNAREKSAEVIVRRGSSKVKPIKSFKSTRKRKMTGDVSVGDPTSQLQDNSAASEKLSVTTLSSCTVYDLKQKERRKNRKSVLPERLVGAKNNDAASMRDGATRDRTARKRKRDSKNSDHVKKPHKRKKKRKHIKDMLEKSELMMNSKLLLSQVTNESSQDEMILGLGASLESGREERSPSTIDSHAGNNLTSPRASKVPATSCTVFELKSKKARKSKKTRSPKPKDATKTSNPPANELVACGNESSQDEMILGLGASLESERQEPSPRTIDRHAANNLTSPRASKVPATSCTVFELKSKKARKSKKNRSPKPKDAIKTSNLPANELVACGNESSQDEVILGLDASLESERQEPSPSTIDRHTANNLTSPRASKVPATRCSVFDLSLKRSKTRKSHLLEPIDDDEQSHKATEAPSAPWNCTVFELKSKKARKSKKNRSPKPKDAIKTTNLAANELVDSGESSRKGGAKNSCGTVVDSVNGPTNELEQLETPVCSHRLSSPLRQMKLSGRKTSPDANGNRDDSPPNMSDLSDPDLTPLSQYLENSTISASPSLNDDVYSAQDIRTPLSFLSESDEEEESSAFKKKTPLLLKAFASPKKVSCDSHKSVTALAGMRSKGNGVSHGLSQGLSHVQPRRMFVDEPIEEEAANYIRYEFDMERVVEYLKDTDDWKGYVTEIQKRPSCLNVYGWVGFLLHKFNRVNPCRFFDRETMMRQIITHISDVNPAWNSQSPKSVPFAEMVTYDIATKLSRDVDLLKHCCICKSSHELKRPSWSKQDKETVVNIFKREFNGKETLTLERVQKKLAEHRVLQDVVFKKFCLHGSQTREKRFYATLKSMMKTLKKS